MFDWDLRVPYGYGNTYRTLKWMNGWLLQHHHPEYVRRLVGWLHYKAGQVGVGGGWRDDGTQPDKPGFAPEGRSFHQNQQFSDGFIGAAAVDTVYRDGPDPGDAHDGIPWREVPVQGSAEAERWGIHANVGYPGKPGGESWHIQPIEIDGYDSWLTAGRPSPILGYPIPTEHDPNAPEGPDSMSPRFIRHADYKNQFVVSKVGGPVSRSILVEQGHDPATFVTTSDQTLADLVEAAGLSADDLERVD